MLKAVSLVPSHMIPINKKLKSLVYKILTQIPARMIHKANHTQGALGI